MRRVEFFDHHRGEFQVWEEPIPGDQYIIGADIAMARDMTMGVDAVGSRRHREGDSSAMCVLRRHPLGVEQVAECLIRCDPVYFGIMIALWARKYNNAIINPERNSADACVAGLRQAGYPEEFWYIPTVSLSFSGNLQSKYFLQKSRSTGAFLISTLVDYLSSGHLLLRSKNLLQELGTLQKGTNGDIDTNGKDLSIALMMALAVDATTAPPAPKVAPKVEESGYKHGMDPSHFEKPPKATGSTGFLDSTGEGTTLDSTGDLVEVHAIP
jgi:hypothetical protein